MRSRIARAVLMLATMLVVWLVTAPARAMQAPLCDPRGAVGFAPPPQLQDLELSLDTGVKEDCGETPEEILHVVTGRNSRGVDPPIAQEPAAAPARAPYVRPLVTARLAAPVETTGGERAGYRAPLERPPRI